MLIDGDIVGDIEKDVDMIEDVDKEDALKIKLKALEIENAAQM